MSKMRIPSRKGLRGCIHTVTTEWCGSCGSHIFGWGTCWRSGENRRRWRAESDGIDIEGDAEEMMRCAEDLSGGAI